MKNIKSIISLCILLIFIMFFESKAQGVYEKNKGVKFEVYKGTEIDIKKYLDDNQTDPIEGIWVLSSSGLINNNKFKLDNYLKVAIIRDNSTSDRDFIVIFISSSYDEVLKTSGWKKYYITSKIDKTSFKNIYNTEDYDIVTEMKNAPKSYNYFIDEYGLLESSISFWSKGIKYDMKDKGVKIYPTYQPNSNSIDKKIETTGSGVVIDSIGIIATNYHVIEGSENISIEILLNGVSKIYIAKVIASDKINDIALLQIEDKNFNSFPTIPYSILQYSEVGESVFTIGFPLNDIMGKNYKLTNGIISSNSGIHDDFRYYQITVPIQPGNSGGPLFNENGDIIGLTTSKLNGANIGANIENVNYAIKSDFILLLAEIAGVKISKSIPSHASKLKGRQLKEQVEILKNFVCIIHCN